MTCLIDVWTVFHSVDLQKFYFCVQSIRAICEVVAPMGTVVYAPGFTGLMRMVVYTVYNKEVSMIIERS